MRANRNRWHGLAADAMVIADGGMRANRNMLVSPAGSGWVIADGGNAGQPQLRHGGSGESARLVAASRTRTRRDQTPSP